MLERYFEKETGNKVVQSIPLSAFAGKRVAIDISVYFYSKMATSKKALSGDNNFYCETPDEVQVMRRALQDIFKSLQTFLKYGILLVIVFDGTPHELKNKCKEKRADSKEKATKKFNTLTEKLTSDPDMPYLGDQIRKAYLGINSVPKTFKEMCVDMVKALGLPCIFADDFGLMTKDAEGVCACLSYNGLIDATYTIDSDYHTYGGNVAIKKIDMVKTGSGYVHMCQVRDIGRILNLRQMPFNCFQDLCILLGTDFNDNITGNGLVANWNFIYEYGTIEYFIREKRIDVEDPEHELFRFREVQQMFRCTQRVIPDPKFKLCIDTFNSKGVQYLTEMGLEQEVQRTYSAYMSINAGLAKAAHVSSSGIATSTATNASSTSTSNSVSGQQVYLDPNTSVKNDFINAFRQMKL